eukprot:1313918-Rhodomonas_salina.2
MLQTPPLPLHQARQRQSEQRGVLFQLYREIELMLPCGTRKTQAAIRMGDGEWRRKRRRRRRKRTRTTPSPPAPHYASSSLLMRYLVLTSGWLLTLPCSHAPLIESPVLCHVISITPASFDSFQTFLPRVRARASVFKLRAAPTDTELAPALVAVRNQIQTH